MTSRGFMLGDSIRIFEGGAVLLLKEHVLIVADAHLGCEAALEYEGLSIPRVQTKMIEDYLVGMIEHIGPRKVVVAGDLKHNFSRNLIQEWKDVSRFVGSIVDRSPLQVLRGNHDNYLSLILKEHGLGLQSRLSVGDIEVFHGHGDARIRGPTILGHIHPSIRLRDSLGASAKAHCFLWDEKREVLVLPALSIVASGTDVVGQASADGMSPALAPAGLARFSPIVLAGGKLLRFPPVGEMRRSQQT